VIWYSPFVLIIGDLVLALRLDIPVDHLPASLVEGGRVAEVIEPHDGQVALRVVRFLDDTRDDAAFDLADPEPLRVLYLSYSQDKIAGLRYLRKISIDDRIAEDDYQLGVVGVLPRQVDRVGDPFLLLLMDEVDRKIVRSCKVLGNLVPLVPDDRYQLGHPHIDEAVYNMSEYRLPSD
jgi:hypothetical protein